MACQKNPYPNQFLAERALEAIRASGKGGKQPVRAYPCQECHRWHLTSKKRRARCRNGNGSFR
jgi:uncharacterized protein YlaI